MSAALTITPASVADLVRCVVMLDRPFTETVKVDGADAEVWLRLDHRARPIPKIDRHVGSAFLVADADAAYVVTAAHVARRMDREARLSFAGRGGRRASRRLSDVLSAGAHAVRWTYAPPADVAAVRIPHPPPALHGRFLPAELLARDDTAPGGTVELLVIGFPLGLAATDRFAPIRKHYHAASEVVRLCGEEMSAPADFFLLDQPAMGGYSGAPVFVAPHAELTAVGDVTVLAPRCVGVVSQTISDEAGGQFAAVVPSRVIRRLLNRVRRAGVAS